MDREDTETDELPPRVVWHRKRPASPSRWLRELRRTLREEDEDA